MKEVKVDTSKMETTGYYFWDRLVALDFECSAKEQEAVKWIENGCITVRILHDTYYAVYFSRKNDEQGHYWRDGMVALHEIEKFLRENQ